MKIMLDPGHYGKYNRSPANKNYYESEAMWKLCGYLKTALESYGITVGVTRKDPNVDMHVLDRGKLAKGYDLLISLHSNAVGSYVSEKTDYVAVLVPLNGNGNQIGNKMVTVVEKIMQTKQKGYISTREGSAGIDHYGVIRGAVSVGVTGIIIEHSFHTCTAMATWLLDAGNLKRLAEVEAKAIAEHYNMKPVLKPEPIDPVIPTATKIVKGSKVKIRAGARWYNGSTIPAWVMADTWNVTGVNGLRAVLGTNISGRNNISSPINVNDLVSADAVTIPEPSKPTPPPVPVKPVESPKPAAIVKGSKVKIKAGAKWKNGLTIPSWVMSDTWVVFSTNGSWVVLDKNVAGTISITSAIYLKDIYLV